MLGEGTGHDVPSKECPREEALDKRKKINDEESGNVGI